MENYTTLTTTQQKTLQILIHDTSEKEPITGANIAKRVGINMKIDKEGMRAVIHALRLKNFPVCATSRGYFYAKTSAELSKFIVKLQARVISQEQSLKGLKESFHNVGRIDNGGETQYTRRVAIRVGPDKIAYRDFPIGSDGKPIIPKDVEII